MKTKIVKLIAMVLFGQSAIAGEKNPVPCTKELPIQAIAHVSDVSKTVTGGSFKSNLKIKTTARVLCLNPNQVYSLQVEIPVSSVEGADSSSIASFAFTENGIPYSSIDQMNHPGLKPGILNFPFRSVLALNNHQVVTLSVRRNLFDQTTTLAFKLK